MFMTTAAAVVLTLVAMTPPAGSSAPRALTHSGFEGLLQSLATAWSHQDTSASLACFTEDAVYMQPPDQQLYRGTAELRLLFQGLKPGTFMRFHSLALNPESQTGFAEFSFGHSDSTRAVHGIVRVALSGGRISSWREYFESGPASFDEFVAIEGKTWKWTGDSLQ